jgi:hypothetical protein
MDQDRRLAREVPGEHQPWAVGNPDLGDPGTEGLDREYDLPTEQLRVELDVAGDVGARHVEEVELAEGLQGRRTSFDWW